MVSIATLNPYHIKSIAAGVYRYPPSPTTNFLQEHPFPRLPSPLSNPATTRCITPHSINPSPHQSSLNILAGAVAAAALCVRVDAACKHGGQLSLPHKGQPSVVYMDSRQQALRTV